MMKSYLEQYLMKKGYQKIATNVTEFSLCFQANDSMVEVISFVEDRPGLYLTADLYKRIKEQAVQLFLDRGYQNIHVMTIIFTDEFDKIREVSGDDYFCWMIDRENRRVVAYENQVDDFYGLREKLEDFLITLPRNLQQETTNDIKMEVEPKKGKWKDYLNVTMLFIVLNLVIFLLCAFEGDLLYNIGVLQFDRLTENQEYYRLITSVFLHADMEHVLSNMLILYMAGKFVEKILGHVRFAILYLLSGIGGSLVSLYIQHMTGEYYISLGASGAVFGLLGALLVFVIMRNKEVEIITGYRLLFYLAYSIYLGFRATNIDNYAHIGGLLSGVILTVLLWITMKNKKGNK